MGFPHPRLARGVPHDKHSVPSVTGADGRSGYAIPERIIPERGQISENRSKPSTKQRWDIFHDDDSGSNLANDSGKLAPESRACAIEARTLACKTEILAWEPAAEDVNEGQVVGSDCADVAESLCVWPVLFQNSVCIRVALHLKQHGAEPSPL